MCLASNRSHTVTDVSGKKDSRSRQLLEMTVAADVAETAATTLKERQRKTKVAPCSNVAATLPVDGSPITGKMRLVRVMAGWCKSAFGQWLGRYCATVSSGTALRNSEHRSSYATNPQAVLDATPAHRSHHRMAQMCLRRSRRTSRNTADDLAEEGMILGRPVKQLLGMIQQMLKLSLLWSDRYHADKILRVRMKHRLGQGRVRVAFLKSETAAKYPV